jgi:hypothetical protein
MSKASGGLAVYDPRGVVEADAVALAPRPDRLDGLRLAVLDNTKWNAGKLLRRTVELLGAQVLFSAVHSYAKESFSLAATPELIARIAAENDLVLTAIGD